MARRLVVQMKGRPDDSQAPESRKWGNVCQKNNSLMVIPLQDVVPVMRANGPIPRGGFPHTLGCFPRKEGLFFADNIVES